MGTGSKNMTFDFTMAASPVCIDFSEHSMQTGLAAIVKSKVIFLETVWVKVKFQVKSKVNVKVQVRVRVNLIANVLFIMKVKVKVKACLSQSSEKLRLVEFGAGFVLVSDFGLCFI